MSTTFDRRFALDGPTTMPAISYKSAASIPQHSQSEFDMRTFSLTGPYGMNISLSTAIGGRFSISFSNRSNNTRASSEPASAVTRIPDTTHSITIPVDNNTIHDSTSVRAPSPAPTEIEDPDPESILAQLDSLNIKVRDFAHEPPYTPSPSTSSTTSAPSPIPELFDQYKGIAEFEYRLAQSPRTVPILGKTMRRLLDLEWVLYDEAEERLHNMDWEALREYDKKNKARGKSYPWRPCTWTEVPDLQERKKLLEERGSWFVNYDKVRKTLDWMEEREQKERMQADVAVRQWEEKMRMVVDEKLAPDSASPSKKRGLDLEDPIASTSTSDDPDAKRPRLSQVQSSSQSQSHPPPPPKQYPAPLSSYDPRLYPDAKSAIELSALSQPRPEVRADTPPARDAEAAVEQQEQRPGALVRKPKRLRRTLSRTQTFTQL